MPKSTKKGSCLRTLTTQYKRDVLALIMRDAIVFKTIIPHIPDDMFEGIYELDVIFTTLREFQQKFGDRPKTRELKEILTEHLDRAIAKKQATEEHKKLVLKTLKRLKDHTSFSAVYVKEKLYDAIVVHKMTTAIDRAPELLDSGEYDAFVASVNEARRSVQESATVYDYWDDVTDRLSRREHKKKETLVPTGILYLDELLGGGVPKGNLAVLIGASGFGKSAFLNWFCTSAVVDGFPSAFFSYELDADAVMSRMDASFTTVPLNELNVRQFHVKRALEEIYDDYKPADLFVRYAPTKSETLMTVSSELEDLRTSQGVTVDSFYLDYFDLLQFPAQGRSDRHVLLEEGMEVLRGLAGKYGMCIWTASQTNRGGVGKELVGMDDIAASYGKTFPLDLLITLSQSEKEKRHGVYKMFIAKSRLCKSQDTIWVRPDFTNMTIECLDGSDIKSLGLTTASSSSKSKSSFKASGV